MDHQSIQEQVSQFLDNELPTSMLQPMFQHLSECDVCRTFFVNSNTIHDTAQKIKEENAPEPLDRKFVALGMTKAISKFQNRSLTIPVPSVVYSIGTVIVMTLFIYIVGSLQEKNLLSQYRQTMSYTGQFRISSNSN